MHSFRHLVCKLVASFLNHPVGISWINFFPGFLVTVVIDLMILFYHLFYMFLSLSLLLLLILTLSFESFQHLVPFALSLVYPRYQLMSGVCSYMITFYRTCYLSGNSLFVWIV
jgi:hypothetical protein